MIELVTIDKSLHENAIVIFITKRDLKINYNRVTEDDDGNSFKLSISKNSIYNDFNKFMVSWCGIDSYFNIETFKWVILK